MKFLKLGLAATLALLVSIPALAQVPRTISYQGMLTDGGGAPVADGSYALTVRLYDDANAGSLLYTEAHPVVAVAGGGFNVIIGSITPLAIAFDMPLWLSLQVGADPELSPRVELASSPYAMGLALPFDGRADGTTPTFTLHNASGPSLKTEGTIQSFGPTGTPVATLSQFLSFGGQLAMRDEANNTTGRMEPDATGTGGYFSIYRSVSGTGFTVDGNSGAEEPVVTVSGSARTARFDMAVAGDASVVLPTSSINSTETLNEAGVAELFANSAVQVGLGVTVIASRTITAPDDGYVIAIGGGHCEIGHVNGTDSRIIYGINDVSNAFATSAWVAGLPSTAPSGNSYRIPCPFTGVWPVTAGSHTFYLLAQRIGAANGIVLNDPTIALIYVPTAYGTVSGNKAFAAGAQPESRGALTDAEISNEQGEAAAFDQARIQRELDQMKAQLASIQSRLSSDPNAAASAAQK